TNGHPIFITSSLHGAIPAGRTFPEATTSAEAFVAMDRLLDNARTGPMYLRMPTLAEIVVEAIRYRESISQYELHAYVVMANHVPLLITPHVEVSKTMQSLKRHTARESNRLLGLTGHPFWAAESYDHLVRGPDEFRRILDYIEMNPVKAGIAT